MAIAVFGAGAVGSQVPVHLSGYASRSPQGRARPKTIGYELEPGDTAILATPCGTHLELASAAIHAGAHVISTTDSVSETQALLELDSMARDSAVTLIVGAGFAPGLSCVLARHGAGKFDAVDGISVSKHGTGGPACARQHHRAYQRPALDWVDGAFLRRPPSSGRDLVWFPDPIGAKDCYRASLPSPILLKRMFPDATRITSRVSGTRRDRLTSRLPMLRPPHPDGGPGAIRVEVRGTSPRGYDTLVYGVAAAPSTATAIVAAVAARNVVDGHCLPGARGLAEQGDPLPWLEAFRAEGIKIVTFQGV